jgi:hypothetical protein
VRGTTLEAGDDTPPSGEVVYVYNVLDRDWEVNQPPSFSAFRIPACKKGEKFAVTTIPRFIKERYEVPGSVKYYYKNVDGRKYATSLLNPAAFPSVRWESQLQVWRSTDQFGNNLNAWGVFWSLTHPDDPKLEKEIAQFRARAVTTMESLVRQGEAAAAANRLADITPNMHFAMDFLRRQASWHMQTDFLVDCPTCGEPVKEGIAYHRNSMNFICPVNVAKCRELGIEFGPTTIMAPTPAPTMAASMPSIAGLDPDEAELVTAASRAAQKEEAQIKAKAQTKKRS